MRTLSAITLVTASIVAARRAHAADPAEAATAQVLFDEAKKLAAAGQYAVACPKFVESQRLDPSGGTILHLAICHSSEGKTATAWTEFNEAVSIARRDGRADREQAAKGYLATLTPKLSTLTIALSPEAKAQAATVQRSGTKLSDAQLGIAIPLDPGEHEVTASAPGKRPWSAKIKLEPAGGTQVLTIPGLAPGDDPPASAVITPAVGTPAPHADDLRPAAPPVDGGSADRRAPQRTVGWVVGGVGIVGLGVGGVFLLSAVSSADKRNEAAAAGDAEGSRSHHEDAKSAQKLGLVVGGVGLVALGAGVVLVLTAPSKTTTAVRVGARPVAGGGAAWLTATW